MNISRTIKRIRRKDLCSTNILVHKLKRCCCKDFMPNPHNTSNYVFKYRKAAGNVFTYIDVARSTLGTILDNA